MTSILQCLHFQLLLPFSSKEKAYRDSFQLTSTLWDETLTDFFKKNFYLELNKKLVTLPFRIALLETGNLKIKNNDMIEPITGYKDNFLGRLLENARKEMYDYLLPENGILQEIIQHNNQSYLIIGLGINLVNSPKIINYSTGYIEQFTKKKIDKNNILENIKKEFEINY